MKERTSGIRRTAGFCFLILLCVLANYFGGMFASAQKLPVWLDSVGTAMAAYVGGPIVGALVGVTGNLIGAVAYGDNWVYAAVSVAIGLLVGIMARKKDFGNLLNVLTAAVILTVVVTAIALPLHVFFGNNSTGNVWGDAVSGFLEEKGFPVYLSLPVGQTYVELLDKLLTLVLLHLVIRVKRLAVSIRNKRELEKQKTKNEEEALHKEEEAAAFRTGALLLAVMLGLSATGGRAAAEAPAGKEAAVNYNDYVQTIYASMNGLPCGEANDIAQTNDGILWIGTYAGLYRYNGREFRWMDGYESVRNVNCLYVDEEGRLWIGTNDNGLSIVINEQVANVIDKSTGLPSNSVRSIVRSSDGYYYIGTTAGMQVVSLNYGLQRENTLSEVFYTEDLAADENGRVAAVTANGVLFLMSRGQILSSRRLTEESSDFKSCTFDPEGYLLAATTGNKIHRFDVSKDWFEEVDSWECGDLTSIKDLKYTEDGILFISADNGIGYRLPDGELERINTNEFNNSIDNMLVDYQGNLWFTSSRLGLLRLAPSDFRDIYSTAGLDNRVVNTVVFWKGTYYFGTDSGLDAVDASCKKRVTDELTEQLKSARIRCMYVDSREHLWICSYGGLIEVDPESGEQHLYDTRSGIPSNRTRVVTELKDGTMVCGGDAGVSFIRDHQIIENLTMARVMTVTELEDGTILAGTDGNGIAVLKDRVDTGRLTRKDGLSSEVILRTIPDGSTGGVFVVTSNGLCYMEPDGTVRSLDNFPYYNNYDIWIQGTDTLFVLSSAGIYVTDREELLSGTKDLHYELLDSRRGLNSSLTANAWTWYNESTEELFLACDTGVFAVEAGSLNSGSKIYRMSIPYMRADGIYHRIDQTAPITVSRGTGKLELGAEVVNYTIQDPYVGFKLGEFDKDWVIVPQNSLSSIVYTNLPSGPSPFRLAVFDNNQENILAERTYTIVKEKEMYDDPWFILYLLTVPMFTVGWIVWLLVRRREERIQKELAEANRQVEMGKQTVLAIARAVDAKDLRTGGHSRRVAIYSGLIAKEFGLSEKDCQDIEWAANMHDIGKIAIPDSILNKDSRLTDEEYEIMKSHTIRGAEILGDFTLLDHVVEGAEYHHERYDGRGYPKGLKGEEIPLYARIIGVADAFDAMTANRVYRKQMDFGYVLGELEKGRGTQFDARFVDILLKLIRDGVIDLNTLYGLPPEKTGQEGAEEKKADA